MPREISQFPLEFSNARFQETNLLEQELHRTADHERHSGLGIGEHAAHLLDAHAATLRDANAELAAKPAQRIHAAGACSHPQRTDAMQPLHRLLFDRFHLDRLQLRASRAASSKAHASAASVLLRFT
jgi:hypothetical protein